MLYFLLLLIGFLKEKKRKKYAGPMNNQTGTARVGCRSIMKSKLKTHLS